jgi:hypothetical protein
LTESRRRRHGGDPILPGNRISNDISALISSPQTLNSRRKSCASSRAASCNPELVIDHHLAYHTCRTLFRYAVL